MITAVIICSYVSVSSLLMYSPISAWWKTTMDMGSTFRHSCVVFAATPKPWNEIEAVSAYKGHWIFFLIWQQLFHFEDFQTKMSHQRYIRHWIHHHSLVLRCVFCDSPQTGFHDVISIQEWLLWSRLHPHLKLQRHTWSRLHYELRHTVYLYMNQDYYR